MIQKTEAAKRLCFFIGKSRENRLFFKNALTNALYRAKLMSSNGYGRANEGITEMNKVFAAEYVYLYYYFTEKK